MKKVRTKSAFITKKNRVIALEANEIIRMPDEDYEEVKDLVDLIEEEQGRTRKEKRTSKGA
jgi:hypothetical protein